MLNNITYSPNLNNNSLFEGKEFASRVNYKKVMGNSTNFTGAFKPTMMINKPSGAKRQIMI